MSECVVCTKNSPPDYQEIYPRLRSNSFICLRFARVLSQAIQQYKLPAKSSQAINSRLKNEPIKFDK